MPSFTDTFIKKPIYGIILSLSLMIIGAASFFDLEVWQYPKIKPMVLNVVIPYIGASAEETVRSVTTPVEKVLTNIEKLDYVSSSTKYGVSQITLNFLPGANVSDAIADVSSKISSIRSQLPKDINEPQVLKVDPSEQPSLYLSILSDQLSTPNIYNYYDKNIGPSFRNLPGVGQITMLGNFKAAMRMHFNPTALNAYQLTLPEAFNYAMTQNTSGPSGKLEMSTVEMPISLVNHLNDARRFQSLAINDQPNPPTLADVAQVEMGEEVTTAKAYINKKPSVFVGITSSTDANPIQVSEQISNEIKQINPNLPDHMKASVLFDSSVYLKESIKMIYHAIFETIVLVFVTMFFTLGSIRIVIIPTVTIPISLLTTFMFMKWFNFTINTLTLLALVLSIGMIVDDAIVVAENVFRHIEEGKTRLQAALVGAREITKPVIMITITLAIIFAPLGFIPGSTGTLFLEFGYTVAMSVIVSGVCALTLSPMMCAHFLPKKTVKEGLSHRITTFMTKVTDHYQNRLKHTIVWKKTIFCCCILMAIISIAGYAFFPKSLVPEEDSGAIYTMINGSPSVNFKYMQEKAELANQITDAIPELFQTATIVGMPISSNAYTITVLKPINERKRSVNEIIASLTEPLSKIPGVSIYQFNPFMVPGSSGFFPVSFVIKSNIPYQEFSTKLSKIMQVIKKHPKFVFSNNDLPTAQSQLSLTVNRSLAAQMGVTTDSINQLLAIAFGEIKNQTFTLENENFYVIADLIKNGQSSLTLLEQLSVRSSNGHLIPLSTFVTPSLTSTPPTINHFQGIQSATINAFLFPGFSQADAQEFLIKNMQKIFPKGTQQDYTGQSRSFNRIQSESQMLFLYSLMFIFVCLVLQYENWQDPLIILSTVPLSLFGALLCLILAGGSINIYTNISILTLFALISKHGILMVDFARHIEKNEKLSSLEAIIKAASVRFRPIVLTSLCMIIGTFPLMLNGGFGSECRFQIGVVIGGGMTIGTLLTLFVLPAFYLVIHRKSA
jgi:multidrug efflux pump